MRIRFWRLQNIYDARVKSQNHDVLAQEWLYGLMTRPDMSIKVERKLHDMRMLVEGAMCQWHMLSTDRRGTEK